MTDDRVRDDGFDAWMDALEDDEPYYLECGEGHGSLPPRRVCPACGDHSLSREPLPATGTIETHTIVHVPTPAFEDDAPYATAIVDFGPVRITGQLVDADVDAVATGLPVELESATTRTTGERVIGFRLS